MLPIVTPEPLYVPMGQKRQARETFKQDASVGAQLAADPRGPARAARRSARALRVQVPALQLRRKNDVVLVQPQLFRSAAPPDIKLPDLFAWSQHIPELPNKPILPGHRDAERGRPAVQPSLAVSNAETRIGQLNVAGQPASVSATIAPPAQSTTPVSFPAAGPEGKTSVDTFEAERANLLASSKQHPKPNEIIQVPPGISPGGAASPGPETGQGNPSATESSAALTASNQLPRETTQASQHRSSGARDSAGTMVGNTGSAFVALPTAGRRAPGRAADPGFGVPEPSAGTDPVPQAGTLRKLHPKDGQFDVVVIESSSSAGTRDSGLVLSGGVVYTVYLEVGAEQPWTLQFHQPAVAPKYEENTRVISLSGGERIQAPYPLSTLIPAPEYRSPATRMYVRGFLNTQGRLEDLTIVGQPSPTEQAILALLGHWRFRPAMDNEVAVRVEVLLTIPAAHARA